MGSLQAIPSDLTLRVKSLDSLMVQKGLVDRAALDALIDTMEHKVAGDTRLPRYASGKIGVIASPRDSVHLDLLDDYL